MRHIFLNLGLSKQNAEILGSRLNERNLLHQSTTFYWYRKREEDLKAYFVKEGSLVYCNDIRNLIIKMDIKYKSCDWRLFIDSSKRSLKGVLLHNGNLYASVPVAHSIHMKETYENLSNILQWARMNNMW